MNINTDELANKVDKWLKVGIWQGCIIKAILNSILPLNGHLIIKQYRRYCFRVGMVQTIYCLLMILVCSKGMAIST